MRPPPISTLFPYTTLFRSVELREAFRRDRGSALQTFVLVKQPLDLLLRRSLRVELHFSLAHLAVGCVLGELHALPRSEEHTSELQSQFHLVCRLLLEKKKK